MDPDMTEEEAWYYFQEASDDLRTILQRRGMNFEVKWLMTARPKKPKPRKKPQSDASDVG